MRKWLERPWKALWSFSLSVSFHTVNIVRITWSFSCSVCMLSIQIYRIYKFSHPTTSFLSAELNETNFSLIHFPFDVVRYVLLCFWIDKDENGMDFSQLSFFTHILCACSTFPVSFSCCRRCCCFANNRETSEQNTAWEEIGEQMNLTRNVVEDKTVRLLVEITLHSSII